MNRFESVSSSFTIGTFAKIGSQDLVHVSLASLSCSLLTNFILCFSIPGTHTTRSISDIGRYNFVAVEPNTLTLASGHKKPISLLTFS